ncbi:hypothetical protein pb186bvf_008903 [Paramecium bursaria]
MYKDLQSNLSQVLCRLEELEHENKFLKSQQSQQDAQMMQNVKLIDQKYIKLFKKYMKCLYRYGIYQSCMNNLLGLYNKQAEQKLTLDQCIEKFGVVYENNKIVDENQMHDIISRRCMKESEELYAIFYPKRKFQIGCQEQSMNLSILDSLQKQSQNYTFQSIHSARLKAVTTLQRDENSSDLVTDHSEETVLNNLTTQRYLDKLQEYGYDDETVNYPKTIKIDKLLNDRQRQIKNISPLKINNSFQEDRVRRFDMLDQTEKTDRTSKENSQRRRSRADRLKQ